jgi:hypothetical protein
MKKMHYLVAAPLLAACLTAGSVAKAEHLLLKSGEEVLGIRVSSDLFVTCGKTAIQVSPGTTIPTDENCDPPMVGNPRPRPIPFVSWLGTIEEINAAQKTVKFRKPTGEFISIQGAEAAEKAESYDRSFGGAQWGIKVTPESTEGAFEARLVRKANSPGEGVMLMEASDASEKGLKEVGVIEMEKLEGAGKN